MVAGHHRLAWLQERKLRASSIIVASLVLWVRIVSAQTISVTTTVQGTSGPWEWVDGGLNTAYEYAYKDTDPAERYPWFSQPTVISTTNGLRFSVGDSLTISYMSGLVAYNYDSGTI